MDSYNDMIRSAALQGLREIKDKRAIPIAMNIAKDNSEPFPKRYSALKILEDRGTNNDTVEKFLIQLLGDQNDKIKQKVIQILGNFKTESALYALKQLEQEELRDSVRRRLIHAIRKIEECLN